MKLADINSLVRIFRTTAWQMAAVYATIPCLWLLVHPFTDFWRKNKAPIKSMALVWLVMWAMARWVIWPYRNLLFYSSVLTLLPGFLFIGLGVLIYRHIGEFGLSRLVGLPEITAKKPQLLITHGIHGRVRHPIYLAHLCCLVGLALSSGLAAVYAMVAFALITGVFLIRFEDKELERRFGEEFRAYRVQIPALIPLVRSRRVDSAATLIIHGNQIERGTPLNGRDAVQGTLD
ncbi:MAG TPA: isoprenylcysteine carboxylmethyltransferase family protein [Candidatus Acidoferrales bacterium]|nr:isoprenylcysteine carboxylmethyltransferase family protein [Candidatus Acidoferrales bacterium]